MQNDQIILIYGNVKTELKFYIPKKYKVIRIEECQLKNYINKGYKNLHVISVETLNTMNLEEFNIFFKNN